jgi:Na+/proline symporter
LFIFLGFILIGNQRDFAVEIIDFSRMDVGMTVAFIAFGIFIIFQSAEYWQRVYAAKGDHVIRRGFTGAAILTVITGLAITIIGLAAHHTLPDILARNAFAEGLNILLPEKYVGAGLVLIFAAIMSSADTQIFVLSSSISVDWMQKFSKKKLESHQIMRRTRWMIVAFSAVGFIFAWFLRDLVAVIIFITGIGFTIIPAVIASFHMKISARAALWSFLSGSVYVLLLVIIASFQPDPFEFFKNNAELAILSIVISAITLFGIHYFDKSRE